MISRDFISKIQDLPPELQKELEEYVESLHGRSGRRFRAHLRLDWAGGLKELRDRFTSVDLQHKAMEWWGAG